VAGVAALIISSGVTDPDAVEKVLKDSARPPNGDKGKITTGKDNRYGAGIVDAQAAVKKAQLGFGGTELGVAAAMGALLLMALRRKGALGLGVGGWTTLALSSSGVFFLGALGLGGLPGAGARALVEEPAAAPPLPQETSDRDGTLDVAVHEAEGGALLVGAWVRALALVDGKAYLADARVTDRRGVARLVRLPHAETWVLADAPGHARGATQIVVEGGLRAVAIDLGVEHAVDDRLMDRSEIRSAAGEEYGESHSIQLAKPAGG